jgi:hypothetical protein
MIGGLWFIDYGLRVAARLSGDESDRVSGSKFEVRGSKLTASLPNWQECAGPMEGCIEVSDNFCRSQVTGSNLSNVY